MKSNHSQPLSHHLFPFLEWVKAYDRSIFRADLLAGITVAVVLIPQAMAYAMLAGLPPIYGLYAGAITPMIAGLWGSLRQLATGPIAIMSLLVLTTLTPMAEPGSQNFIDLAILLGHIVGLLYLLIGILRMGHGMAFISHSAVRGFTAAAALIIIATQVPNLLGLTVEKHEYIFPMLLGILKGIPSVHASTALIGLISFAIIYGLKRIRPTFPAGLLALLLTTWTVYFFNLHESGIRVVGPFPSGLPRFELPIFDMDIGFSLIGPAVVIALVSFAETYSVGKVISSETRQKVDVNQEFIGQGLANVIGSFFQCPPVSGSFSRSAINFSTGARTGISGVVSSIIVIIALLFLTPFFTYIPKATLAALVISAVLLLFHPKEVFILWKKNHHDGVVAVTVFILALLVKPDYALLIGVMISLMLFLWKTMRPRIIRVSKDLEHDMFVNADVYKKPSCPQILHLRSDNAIYFANAEYTVEYILKRVDEVETPLKFLLLDCTAIGFIDITGTDEFSVLREELNTRNIRLTLTGVRLPVMKIFKTSGFRDELPGGVFDNKGDAITNLFHDIDHEYCRQICPHCLYFECLSVK